MCDDKMGNGSKEGGSCCGGHSMVWGHKSWLCWLLGAVVLMIVFCMGYKLGMLRAYLGGFGYGHGRNYPHQMMMYRGDAYDAGYRGGMMGNWQYAEDAQQLEDQVTSSLKQ